jgi:alanyl-tRNA synthetase
MISDKFISYFKNNDHTHVNANSVVQTDDPTLLFTNAGMNQFKEVLLGNEQRSYKRACSIQPCMRVGGKHNDLDEVGKNGRHLTWFEMLGNWSFGDYFREQAIKYAHDFVFQDLALCVDKIYVSVYKTDHESYDIWRKLGIKESHIVHLGDIEQGDEENFWSMGKTGPCGRCSELYFDQGEKHFGVDVIGGNSDRFLEFWNLVFMEYDRDDTGNYNPLSQHGVDTGMGLERITALLEGERSVFNTSIFQPVIRHIKDSYWQLADDKHKITRQIIADHSRAITFALRDGGRFGSQSRDYVLRRIARRAMVYGYQAGLRQPFLHQLVEPWVLAMPHHKFTADATIKVIKQIKQEEQRFFNTLDKGMVTLENLIAQGDIIGKDAFKLYDTYGFPSDLIAIIADKQHRKVDWQGFEEAMEQQKQLAKTSATFSDNAIWHSNNHQKIKHDTNKVAIVEYAIQSDHEAKIMLDNSIKFYCEGGGEVGDRGTLTHEQNIIYVDNVIKTSKGIVLLVHSDASSVIADLVTKAVRWFPQIDINHRQAKSCHHTATHLLHAALRAKFGANNIKQAGSLVEHNRLRFDVTFDRPITKAEQLELENEINAFIIQGHNIVIADQLSYDEAITKGAIAFFGEKYGEYVRMVDINGISSELCGGNHVNNLSEIGSFYITHEEAAGSGIRRIYAVVQQAAIDYIQQQRQIIIALRSDLNTSDDKIRQKVSTLNKEVASLKKQKQQLLQQQSQNNDELKPIVIADSKFVVADMSAVASDVKDVSIKGDAIIKLNPDVISVLFTYNDQQNKTIMVIQCGKNAKQQANKIVKYLTTKLNGRGGGKPSFAQTGIENCLTEADIITSLQGYDQ